MPLPDNILSPIPGDNPSGADLRYDPIYPKIKEARREEEDLPQGEMVYERKVADWNQVLKLSSDALTTRSKDLQLAAWLTEALIRKEGFAGLRQGLELFKGLLENFWDTLYPAIEEDGNAEMRAVPLDWIGSRLDPPLRRVVLTKQGYDWFQYKETATIPTEEEAGKDSKKAELRSAKLADGKLSPEQWDKAFEGTSKAFYVGLVEVLDACLELADSIVAACEGKFGDAAPSFSPLKTTLEEIRHTANLLLKKKRELEPDPLPEGASAEEAGAAAGPAAEGGAFSWAGMGLVSGSAVPPEAVYQMAQQAARAGRLQEAIRLLTDHLAADASARGRFIRRTQIAQICLESGQDSIAMPILQELAAEIDKRNLEDWEFGEVLARPLALLYKCMVKQDSDHDERVKLYARVCRLNPFEALTVAR